MPDPDERADSLIEFGSLCYVLYSESRRTADLEKAISVYEEAVDLTYLISPTHPKVVERLDCLGLALQQRFHRQGDITDIERAIQLYENAVSLMDDANPDKSGPLSNFGNALETRFEQLGNLKDIEKAISVHQMALNLTVDDHPEKPGRFSNLGNALARHFDRLGSLTDIDNAILSHQKAVNLTPNGHPDEPRCLSNLGNALQSRFIRLGSLADIDNAILSLQKAVDVTSDRHPNKPGRLSSLGNALGIRFGRFENLKDIESAIVNKQKAVDLTPDGHPAKPRYLSNLGNALKTRFNRLGTLEDIDNAILSIKKAVDFTPDGHPEKPGRLSNLGLAHETRFDHLGYLKDIESAILSIQKAVDLTPDNHPDKLACLCNLGNVLSKRLKWLHRPDDLEDMLHAYSQAAESPIGSPSVRFNAAYAWATFSDKLSRPSLAAYSCAIDLLPRIAWLGLPITDQHALLADVGGIVRKAVSAAVKSEELETAVEWAEQGRSIVWQNMLGLRTPVDDLRAKYPQLADKIQAIARQLEPPTSHDVVGANIKSSQLAIDWENTVEEIRSLPGFEGFLKAKTFTQLAPVAHEGPVVILNVGDSQSDAIVLISDDSEDKRVSVVNIPLPQFSYETGRILCEKLADLLKSSGLRARGETRKTGRIFPGSGVGSTFQKILRILWQDVVQPVINGLGYQVCHYNDE